MATKTNLTSLGDQLRREIKTIQLKASDKVKDIATKILDTAIERTKIDTSKAKSNWQVSLENPIDNGIDAHFKGEKGSTINESTKEAKTLGRNAINNKKIGESIFIVNNAELVPDFGTGSGYVKDAKLLEAQSEAYTEGIILAEKANLLARNE